MINEALTSQEAKQKFRSLVMKYHPDKGGDERTAQRINHAKDIGDEAIDKLYSELMGSNFKPSSNVYQGFNVDESISRMKQWILEPNFMDFMKNNYLVFKFSKDSGHAEHPIMVQIVMKRPNMERMVDNFYVRKIKREEEKEAKKKFIDISREIVKEMSEKLQHNKKAYNSWNKHS